MTLHTFFPLIVLASSLSLIAARTGSRVLLRCLQVTSMAIFLVLWYTVLMPDFRGSMGAFFWLWPPVVVLLNLTRWHTIEDRLIRQAQGPTFFLQLGVLGLAAWFLWLLPPTR